MPFGYNSSNVAECLRKIESGDFDFTHIQSLLMALRDDLSTSDTKGLEILLDVINCIHHPKRDRGVVFEHAKAMVDDMISGISSGKIQTSLNPKDADVILLFDRLFTKFRISYDKHAFANQAQRIVEIIRDRILDQTIIAYPNPKLEYCRLISLHNGIFLSMKFLPFHITLPGGGKMTGNPTINVPIITFSTIDNYV